MVTPRIKVEASGEVPRHAEPHRLVAVLRSFRWATVQILLGESFSVWQRHNGSRLAASLSFYTLLSLTPLLLIVVSIAGLAFGRQAAQSQLLWQIRQLVGSQGANAIQPLLQGARHTTQGVLATVSGIADIPVRGIRRTRRAAERAQHNLGGAGAGTVAGLQMIAYLVRVASDDVWAGLLSIGFLLIVSWRLTPGLLL